MGGLTEVELCAQIFEYTAENGPDMLKDEERKHAGGKKRGVVTYQPIGVIYQIQPWNFPLYQPVRVLAANLMAGNGCVLKHASICTGSGLRLRELCIEAGLPEELFQVILIDHDTSDKLIEHPKVRGVTMTGSDGAGRHIGSVAAKSLKKTVLELGSNDAYLVLEDADIETAVKFSVMGRRGRGAVGSMGGRGQDTAFRRRGWGACRDDRRRRPDQGNDAPSAGGTARSGAENRDDHR